MSTEDINNARNYLELTLLECGKEKCIAEKRFSFTEKDYHLFHYVSEGKGTFVFNNIQYEIKPGMLFYIPPHTVPVYYPDHDDPWTYIWLGFSGSNSDQIVKSLGLSSSNLILSDIQSIIGDRIQDIYNTYRDNGFLDLYCLGKAYEIFGLLLKAKKTTEEFNAMSTKEGYVKAAKEFILNNYQFEIHIDDVSKNVGISSNYLANIFNELEKDSPKRFITRTRMEKAQILLGSNNLKIKTVAEMVGYKNQLHFSNEFKKAFGSSPLKFREELNNKRRNQK